MKHGNEILAKNRAKLVFKVQKSIKYWWFDNWSSRIIWFFFFLRLETNLVVVWLSLASLAAAVSHGGLKVYWDRSHELGCPMAKSLDYKNRFWILTFFVIDSFWKEANLRQTSCCYVGMHRYRYQVSVSAVSKPKWEYQYRWLEVNISISYSISDWKSTKYTIFKISIPENLKYDKISHNSEKVLNRYLVSAVFDC